MSAALRKPELSLASTLFPIPATTNVLCLTLPPSILPVLAERVLSASAVTPLSANEDEMSPRLVNLPPIPALTSETELTFSEVTLMILSLSKMLELISTGETRWSAPPSR